MTDGRFDGRRGSFEPPRDRNDRFDRSNRDRDDRGFLDRARDEVSSWFGDDDAEQRREREYRSEGSGRHGRARENDQQGAGYRGEGNDRPYTGRVGSAGVDEGRERMSQHSGRRQEFDRDKAERTSFQGMPQGRHDSDYSQWRCRQIEELDRDYDEFRHENQSRFDSEFSTWRGQRQAKRQLLGNVTENMDVVGSDDQPLGKVDGIKGDRIILAKHDSVDGRHHIIPCAMLDRVEDNKVILSRTADEARREFTRSDRDRALFERDDQGEDGPHMLNRSFSGTY